MRILWVSDSPVKCTGYGTQTALLVPRLQKAGHEIYVYALDHVGEALQHNGVTVFGANGDVHGTLIADMATRVNADIVISLKNLHVLDPGTLRQMGIPWCPLVMVETEPLARMDLMYMPFTTQPLAVTRHGQRSLAMEGIQALYTPFGIDTEAFQPGDKLTARKKLNLPESAFIAAFVGANQTRPSRKALEPLLIAWASMVEQDREALLWLHTDMEGRFQGVDLNAMLQVLGIPQANWRSTDQTAYWVGGVPVDYLRTLYVASDVLVNPTVGGGFELTMVEAAACGTPVIACDFTAMHETALAGWKIATRGAHRGGAITWDARGGFVFQPSPEGILTALNLSADKHDDSDLQQKARERAMRYNIDTVIEQHWLPALMQIDALVNGAQLERMKGVANAAD